MRTFIAAAIVSMSTASAAAPPFAPGTPFPPGQLDYLLYPPETLEPLGAFVFETDDLLPAALESLGLTAVDSDDASDHRPLVIDFTVRPGGG